MSADEPSLFSPAEPDSRWFLLTNRFNLLEFLSSELVSPVEGLSKYYSDLLRLAPGRLPLIRAPFHESIVDVVMEEDDTAFPVALEFSSSLLEATAGGHEAHSERLRAPVGLMPMSCVAAVHFRSQEELDEHAAREYENVRAEAPPLRVTPEIFGGGDLPMSIVADELAALPPSGVLVEQLEYEDRINGAMCGLAAAAPATTVSMKAVGSVLVGKKPPVGELPRWLVAPLIEGSAKDAGTDGQLFDIAFETFRVQDRSTAWRPLEVLDAVEQKVAERGLQKKHAIEIGKNLTPIRAILRNERDFKVFDPSSGLSSAKAILLVLLRPDLDRLLSWDPVDTGATAVEYSAAAVLAGALRGLKRMPVSVRSATLDRLLALRTATVFAGRATDRVHLPTPAPMEATEVVTDSGEFVVSLKAGRETLVERRRPAPTASELLARADLNGVDRDLALEICRGMGWHDCTIAHVSGSALDVALDVDGRAIRVRVRGASDVRFEIEEASFRERLASAGVSAVLASQVLSRLGARTDSA